MKPRKADYSAAWLVVVLFFMATSLDTRGAGGEVIYSTGFEASEGYEINVVLDGQQGWMGYPTHSDGVDQLFSAVEPYDGSSEQYAVIGDYPPEGGHDTAYLFRPIDFDPLGEELPLVTFEVSIWIGNSTNAVWDAFRWSVYNIPLGTDSFDRLFSIEFDNAETRISYLLEDDAEPRDTGLLFVREGWYDLRIVMNFAENRWSAFFVGDREEPIIEGQPMTTLDSRLSLGEIDAVWLSTPGEGFGTDRMVFDDYRITAEPLAVAPFRLESIGRMDTGEFSLRLYGEDGRDYAIEMTRDFDTWTSLKTNRVSGGWVDFVDRSGLGQPSQFYRARLVP